MNIAICEDSISDLQWLQEQLTAVISGLNLDAVISCFGNGEALLSAITADFAPSICFLDIYMKGITGVDTAREIKRRHPQCVIVFVTSSPDHMADGFDIGAVHYLLKPVEKENVETALNRALAVVGHEARFVELTVSRQPRRVLLSDVLYAETQAKCCHIYVKNEAEPLRVYIKLGELEALLSHERFLRCHHSYIVNLDAVSAPTADHCFLMQNGAKVPIRQRNQKEILSAYNDYYFERLRRGEL